jgi:H+/Cl- antiporter ClcA
MGWIIVVVVAIVCTLLGVALAYRLGPRVGLDMHPRLTPAKKRRLAIMLTITVAVALLIVWALGTGHTALGISVLLAVMILPEFVLIPMRITRSRRRADAARARRQARRS